MAPLEPSPTLAADLERRVGEAGAGAILDAALDAFHPRLACACSLGLEDVVLLDLIARRERRPRVFVLDTGRLHQATYDTLAAVRGRYGLPIEVYFPSAGAVEALVTAKGPNSFYESLENRRECCRIRKVEPLARALAGAAAWITGLRRGPNGTRGGVRAFQWDPEHGGLVQVNPLAAWTLEQVRGYVRDRDVPHNPLHDQGYPSIGCAPCTRAVGPGEPERAGRWWWEEPGPKECGLHPALDRPAAGAGSGHQGGGR